MTLIEFAKLAGVIVFESPRQDGIYGKYSYKTLDHPNFTFSGYRTKTAAYKDWFDGEFGENTAQALYKLFTSTKKGSK